MNKILTLFLALLMASCQNMWNDSSDLPTRWMGPNGNGIYPETGLLKEWPPEGPEILWTYEDLGIGFSSAVFQNGFIYITGMIDSTGYLYKLNLKGEQIYQAAYGSEWTGSTPGTRGSPTVMKDKIYHVSGNGKVSCFNEQDGSVMWSKELFKDFGGKNITWGINETPVIDGDLIFLTPGGAIHNVIALNRHTGELVWSCQGEGELSAYSSPLLFNHNDRKILTTYTAGHLLGIDAVSGTLLWPVDVHTRWSVHFCTPVYLEGSVFFPTGLRVGGGRINLNEEGDSVKVVWMNNMNEYRNVGLLIDGHIYGSFSERKDLTWRCTDWDTGEEIYSSRELGEGYAIYADNMLYIYTFRGELALVIPDPTGFNIVSQTKVNNGSGMHMSYPTMHNGVLYIRHGNALIAYSIQI